MCTLLAPTRLSYLTISFWNSHAMLSSTLKKKIYIYKRDVCDNKKRHESVWARDTWCVTYAKMIYQTTEKRKAAIPNLSLYIPIYSIYWSPLSETPVDPRDARRLFISLFIFFTAHFLFFIIEKQWSQGERRSREFYETTEPRGIARVVAKFSTIGRTIVSLHRVRSIAVT